jgi:transposase-like protein
MFKYKFLPKTRIMIVKEYLTGGTSYLNREGSYKNIAVRFKIHAASTVLQWVKQYNNHMNFTDSRPRGVVNMVKNKGRNLFLHRRTIFLFLYPYP